MLDALLDEHFIMASRTRRRQIASLTSDSVLNSGSNAMQQTNSRYDMSYPQNWTVSQLRAELEQNDIRLLPKLTEMVSKLENQSKKFDECNVKIKELEESIDEKIKKKVEEAIESYREREERKCNVIFHNVPESSALNKKEEDGAKLREILAVMKCDEIEPKAFVRLGRPVEGRKRLVKVVLDSVSKKHQLLSGTKLLREKDGDGNIIHGWSNIFVTPDLTKVERDKNRALRLELEKRKADEKKQKSRHLSG